MERRAEALNSSVLFKIPLHACFEYLRRRLKKRIGIIIFASHEPSVVTL